MWRSWTRQTVGRSSGRDGAYENKCHLLLELISSLDKMLRRVRVGGKECTLFSDESATGAMDEHLDVLKILNART